MSKSKAQNSSEHMANLVERFQYLPSENIASRLVNFNKSNDISIAYKQILKERGIDDYLSFINSFKSQ
jgi:hypothetical protein